MPSQIKNIVIGVFVGTSGSALIGMALFFSMRAERLQATATLVAQPTMASSTPTGTSSITPTSPSPTATPSFTPTPTFTTPESPTPIDTPSDTPTPDPIQATIDSGGLVFLGPWPNDQQIALYRASLNYARSTISDSKALAKEINGVGYGDPTNICGPLAAAILRDAGLIDASTTPHDFWLLNPLAAGDQVILRKAFPSDQFEHSKVITPLNEMDWQSSPLEPGDFLFIWHGSGGNFDHMLVVSRIDSAGRAYAVTNFGTQDGYIIAEALLYDPNDPTIGLFHQWTRERNAILGSTGFGGFELWRRRSP